MSKVKKVQYQDGRHYGWSFKCPGCGDYHCIPTNHADPQKNWEFNGNPDSPTFSPSLKVGWVEPLDMPNPGTRHVCHSFIRDGRMQFLSDCTHKHAGQTLDMADVVLETLPEIL